MGTGQRGTSVLNVAKRNIATFVRRLGSPVNPQVARQEIFKVDPPMGEYHYVLVSAADVMYSGPETYIFGSDENGEVHDWAELDGSYRGGLDIDTALLNAGYVVRR